MQEETERLFRFRNSVKKQIRQLLFVPKRTCLRLTADKASFPINA